MGSPLGPIMAAFAIDMVESKFLQGEIKPLFYERNVDDVFALFRNSEEAERFLEF
jgi:hypothetical protein